MGVDLDAFNAAIDRFAKKIEAQGVAFQTKVAFMVLGAYVDSGDGIRAVSGVLHLTPVDTGRAIGNWQLTLDAPAAGTIDAGSKGQAPAANRKLEEARVIHRATATIRSLRFGQTIWIVNNVAYIRVLNDGGVNRAANHMVERALGNTLSALKAGSA